MPKHWIWIGLLCCAGVAAQAQVSLADKEQMARARALYDAPYTRDLASFNCDVLFDWKAFLTKSFGTIPPTLQPLVERLQQVGHRVTLERNRATVTTIPEHPDWTGFPRAADMDLALQSIINGGLSAWTPASSNVLLPTGGTQYSFAEVPGGYQVKMSGAGVDGTLQLDRELRLTGGLMRLPEPMRFRSEFQPGPQGLLLASVATNSRPESGTEGDATFAYTYQEVEGHQLPATVMVSPATGAPWELRLTGCKIVKFFVVEVAAPPE